MKGEGKLVLLRLVDKTCHTSNKASNDSPGIIFLSVSNIVLVLSPEGSWLYLVGFSGELVIAHFP
jgi:hypothetical protein